MKTTIQVARGKFSKFIENCKSNIENPVPPELIATKAAELLIRDFNYEITSSELLIKDGPTKGEFDGFHFWEVLNKVSKYCELNIDELKKQYDQEINNYFQEYNVKRLFPAGTPFFNMDGDKVDLLVSCGDNYIARLPMERMTIDKYIDLKNPSKNKIKPTDDTKYNWRKEIVDYLKNVKCQDSDEQQEVNGLIDTINSFNSDYSNTSKSTKINRDIGLDMMSEQLERFFKSLEDKSIKPIIYDHKIMLVRVEESESPDGISIRISATPSKDPETYIMSIFNKNFKTINLED